MTDTTHLDAIFQRKLLVRQLRDDATSEGARNFHQMRLDQIEKEYASELAFLGMDSVPADLDDISDEELLSLLSDD